MKTILTICLLTLMGGSFVLWRALRSPDQVGTFAGAPETEAVDVMNRPADFLHRTVKIKGEVRNQCTTMGCYFFFSRARRCCGGFGGIARNAPRRNGRTARVEDQVVPYSDGYQFVASYYRRGSEVVKALDGVDIAIRPGEIAIARALIMDSKILVADEPTGNLDKTTGEAIASFG